MQMSCRSVQKWIPAFAGMTAARAAEAIRNPFSNRFLFVRSEPRLGLHPAALQALASAAVLEPVARRSPSRGFVPLRQPVSARRAEPWRLRRELRQSELL